MPIISKDQAQSKADNRLDKNMFKKQKQKPLMEREFSELVSLKDQLKWIELKQKEKDRNI